MFLATLRRRLADSVDGKLAKAVTSIHVMKCKGKPRNLDGEFYEKKLPQLYESQPMLAKPDFDKMKAALIECVMKELSTIPAENCRPRCRASCPRCGSMCYHAKGHSAAKHDTVPQPSGLNGDSWSVNSTLVEKSCLRLVETP
ncbi:hypothetical protein GOP47_0030385, partial [Adiantum capillus-veneris]